MPGDRTIGGEDDAFNNFVSVTGAGVHVPCAVRRSRADGCSVCVYWHVPAVAPSSRSWERRTPLALLRADITSSAERSLTLSWTAQGNWRTIALPVEVSSFAIAWKKYWALVTCACYWIVWQPTAGRSGMCSCLVGLWRMHQAYLSCACTRHAWLECCFPFLGLQLMVVASFHSGYRCTMPPEIISNESGFFRIVSRFEFDFRRCDFF